MRWLKYPFAVTLLSLIVAGCAASPEAEISFTVIAEGDTAADYPDQQGVVIDSPAEWEGLWEQLHRNTIPRPALPEVDFEQYTLLAVFAGEKRSGGYAIQVEKVTQTEGAVIVHTIETAPGADQMAAAQITYPYQVVKMSCISLPVQFKFERD
jgi:hypothetical protein